MDGELGRDQGDSGDGQGRQGPPAIHQPSRRRRGFARSSVSGMSVTISGASARSGSALGRGGTSNGSGSNVGSGGVAAAGAAYPLNQGLFSGSGPRASPANQALASTGRASAAGARPALYAREHGGGRRDVGRPWVVAAQTGLRGWRRAARDRSAGAGAGRWRRRGQPPGR
ncbi:hypothetical protein ACRAWD_27410 [Caulobacter segnis]